jgi:hypothetical protein
MNLSQMQKAIYERSIQDIGLMDIDELRAELTHFYEKEIFDMGSEEIKATYEYMTTI